MPYMLLSDGDTVEPTDEYLRDDAETWTPVSDKGGLIVGMEYRMGRFQPLRRPVSPEQRDTAFREMGLIFVDPALDTKEADRE